MANHVGSMTRILRTEYYEDACEYSGSHHEHLRAVTGAGGNGQASPSYRHGSHTKTELTTYEYWCPGVKKQE